MRHERGTIMRKSRKTVYLFAVLLLFAAVLTGCSSAGGEPVKQAAGAPLDQDGNRMYVTVDLSGGWSVEFASGAFYLSHGDYKEDMPSAAIGITLDQEVYDEYCAEAVRSDSYRELSGGVTYTQEDGTNAYLMPVGDDAYLALFVEPEEDGDAVFARVKATRSEDNSGEIYTESELYTPDEMDSAMVMIVNQLLSWTGCELHDLRYAGDECNSDENIRWLNELSEGKNYAQCIEFLTDFHSPTDEADLEGTAWEPDHEYTDYQWWLARADGGDWELVSWGY